MLNSNKILDIILDAIQSTLLDNIIYIEHPHINLWEYACIYNSKLLLSFTIEESGNS